MGASASKLRLSTTDHDSRLSPSASFPLNVGHESATRDKTLWTSGNCDCTEKDLLQVGFSSTHQAVNESSIAHGEKSMLRTALLIGSRRGVPKQREIGRRHGELHSVPSSPSHEGTDETWVPIWQNKLKTINVKPVDKSSDCFESGSSSFRLESFDAKSGLKLLLSPVNTPSSKSLPASSRFANVTKNLSSSGGFDDNLIIGLDFSKHLSSLEVCERESDIEGMGDTEEPGSPLFDPSILATFERAIEASSDDTWQTSEVSTSSSSRVACFSSDVHSDADSPNWSDEHGAEPDVSCINHLVNNVVPGPMGKSNDSISTPLFKSGHNQKDLLEDFQDKCPPGCENKIVLYFTSLRGIRKTYENCCLIRCILKGFGVPVDARDIWMHSKFREELTHVMGATLSVPRLFIKGRYIGGAEDVRRLHEEGILEYLLEGFPAECNTTCSFCGGIRFVPCNTCGGSCKIISVNKISRCPDCNENGLTLCPSCG